MQQARDAVLAEERARAEVLAAGALQLVDSPEARGVLAAFAHAQRPRRLEGLPTPTCERATLSADGLELLCLTEQGASLWARGEAAPRWTRPGVFTSANAGGPDTPVWLSERVGNLTRHHALNRDGSLRGESEFTRVPALVDVRADRAMGHNTALLGVLDANGGMMTEDFGCGRSMAAATLAPDPPHLHQLCVDGQLLIGDAPLKPERRLSTPYQAKREPTRVVVLPELGVLVVATHRGELGAVDLETGEVRRSLETGLGIIRVLRPSPDGRRVAVLGVRGGARIWDPATGNSVAAIPGESLQDLAWEDDEVLVALGQELTRWAVPRVARPTHVSLNAGVAGVDVAPDGARFAVSLGASEVVDVPLDGAPPARIRVGFQEVAKATAYSLDGRWLATTSRSPPVLAIVDRGSGAQVLPADGDPVRRQVFVSSGALVGITYGSSLDLRRPPGFTRQSDLPQVPSPLFDIGATPDGRWAVAVDETGLLHLLDGEALRLRPLFSVPGAAAVDLHPDGQRVAAATLESVRLYSLDGTLLRELPAPGAGHRDLAFSASGNLIAAGGLDGLTRVWDTESGALLAVLGGHTSRVSALQFSPVAPVLVTGSWDESARVWDLRGLRTEADVLAQEVTESWGLSAAEMLER
ncbi:MAG: hypothetical protein H6741_20560 [Alphaproteobacteria bacterium]|nr:hypothetical protein [Alphaproteobacteria bacterium]MCB9795101.1 hypothetical protein [Alphaproteobacteria bacterium]